VSLATFEPSPGYRFQFRSDEKKVPEELPFAELAATENTHQEK
jgi:hypothetical protein